MTETDTVGTPLVDALPLAGTHLTDQQAVAAAKTAGFTGVALVTSVAIAIAESGLDPGARNTNTDGSIDRGILQINSKWHPEVSDRCADTPACAFKQAFSISSQGTNFSPWSTFNSGAYQQYVEQVKTAIQTLSTFHVPNELHPWPYGWSQLRDWTADGRPDENKRYNCGPESLAECLKHLTNVELPADYIHDVIKGEGYSGYFSLEDLQSFLERDCSIASDILSVDASQPYRTGALISPAPAQLFAAIETELAARHPIIGVFSFSAPNAPDGHMRPITGTDTLHDQVITSDPWLGARRPETHASFWAWSKGQVLRIHRRRAIWT